MVDCTTRCVWWTAHTFERGCAAGSLVCRMPDKLLAINVNALHCVWLTAHHACGRHVVLHGRPSLLLSKELDKMLT